MSTPSLIDNRPVLRVVARRGASCELDNEMMIDAKQAARLRNERIELVQLHPADVSDDYVGWLSDPQVVRYLEVRFGPRDRPSVAEFVRQCIDRPHTLLLGIRDAKDGAHVGNIKLAWNAAHASGDIGVMIGDKSRWSRGFATQAVKVLSNFALEEIKLRKIVAGIYRTNAASVKAFERAGYELEAVLRDHVILEGQAQDVLLFALHAGRPPRRPGTSPAAVSECLS